MISCDNVTMLTKLRNPQDIQDEIFKKMSADEKIKLGSEFWLLAKDLVGDKIFNHDIEKLKNPSKK